MDIFRLQFKRILCSPFFLGLLAVFLVFNFYLISTLSGEQQEINLINDVAGQTGVQINPNFEKKFRPIVNTHIGDLGELYRQKIGKAPTDANAMAKSLSEQFYELSAEQKKRFRDDCAIIQLDGAVKGRNAIYEDYSVTQDGKIFLKQGKVTGTPAAFITHNCAELQDRVVQIKTDGEKDTLFFPGTVYQVHSFLYDTLFRAIVMESAILGALAMFFAVNYEFTHGTQNLAYTSRRGRRLTADQFRAAMLAGMLVPVFLMVTALPVFFANYHFSNVWGSYVSSAMNAEPHGMQTVPYVTFWPMTMWKYLWAHIGLALVIQAVFCLLAFAVAIFCRNNYIGFLGYALGWMITVNIPYVLPWNTMVPLILWANPVIAWGNCSNWLTQIGVCDAYPWYHLLIFLLGAATAAVAGFFGIRRFRRADL